MSNPSYMNEKERRLSAEAEAVEMRLQRDEALEWASELQRQYNLLVNTFKRLRQQKVKKHDSYYDPEACDSCRRHGRPTMEMNGEPMHEIDGRPTPCFADLEPRRKGNSEEDDLDVAGGALLGVFPQSQSFNEYEQRRVSRKPPIDERRLLFAWIRGRAQGALADRSTKTIADLRRALEEIESAACKGDAPYSCPNCAKSMIRGPDTLSQQLRLLEELTAERETSQWLRETATYVYTCLVVGTPPDVDSAVERLRAVLAPVSQVTKASHESEIERLRRELDETRSQLVARQAEVSETRTKLSSAIEALRAADEGLCELANIACHEIHSVGASEQDCSVAEKWIVDAEHRTLARVRSLAPPMND